MAMVPPISATETVPTMPAKASSGGRTMSLKSSKLKQKDLIFDRRYGWVFDERRGAVEEALAGGRGRFCVVPLAKGLFGAVSCLISAVANTTVGILDKPDLFSIPHLQARIEDQFINFSTHVKVPEWKIPMFKGKALLPSLRDPSHLLTESGEPHRSEVAQV